MQLTGLGIPGIERVCVVIMRWYSVNFPSPNSQASSPPTHSPEVPAATSHSQVYAPRLTPPSLARDRRLSGIF